MEGGDGGNDAGKLSPQAPASAAPATQSHAHEIAELTVLVTACTRPVATTVALCAAGAVATAMHWGGERLASVLHPCPPPH